MEKASKTKTKYRKRGCGRHCTTTDNVTPQTRAIRYFLLFFFVLSPLISLLQPSLSVAVPFPLLQKQATSKTTLFFFFFTFSDLSSNLAVNLERETTQLWVIFQYW